MDAPKGYWHLITLAIYEMDACEQLSEYTWERLERHGINPIEVMKGWEEAQRANLGPSQ